MPEYDLSSAQWRKSSHSDDNGGSCLEVAYDFVGAARWRKSTYSDGDGGNCVEVSDGHPGVVPVRDSKTPDGPALIVQGAAWTTFTDAVSKGRL
ncbi:DUF397 domain-containing protein [Streptomyces himalayensis]|uniref:DUF397 domain-containing protein n=1 Tax=Streptomyces himalayensis subsp. himalayensis TaxID=2756131 RepID=A0A7W0DQ45_9ACTN|nr:DUF397 domain-containing protein [Streptomyces himalayensis]MBA2949156.1 DUF397 domain-containing protein [Streptomyces himalayensis subsp. himalayensis]